MNDDGCIFLTVEQASALKGAAQMGLAYFRRHEHGRRDLPAVQGAIDEVRRQLEVICLGREAERTER